MKQSRQSKPNHYARIEAHRVERGMEKSRQQESSALARYQQLVRRTEFDLTLLRDAAMSTNIAPESSPKIQARTPRDIRIAEQRS